MIWTRDLLQQVRLKGFGGSRCWRLQPGSEVLGQTTSAVRSSFCWVTTPEARSLSRVTEGESCQPRFVTCRWSVPQSARNSLGCLIIAADEDECTGTAAVVFSLGVLAGLPEAGWVLLSKAHRVVTFSPPPLVLLFCIESYTQKKSFPRMSSVFLSLFLPINHVLKIFSAWPW